LNRLIVIILLFCFSSFTLYASQIIKIDKNTNHIEVLSKSQIFIDTTKKLQLEDIKTQSFQQNNETILSYGYSPNLNLWIRFTVKNNTKKPLKKVLEYNNPLTTHILFFDENKIYKDGLYQINKNRISLNPVFPINLKPNEEKTYYIKVSSYITTLIVKLNLLDKLSLDKQQLKHQITLALFFGAMFIFVLYNLFIYFFMKDKSYLFYVFSITGIIIHQLAYTGIANLYLLNQTFIIYSIESAALIVAFPIYTFAIFSRYFLKTTQYKTLDKYFVLYLKVFPFLIAIFLVSDKFDHYRNIFSVILLIAIIIITAYAVYKKNRQAYFVFSGWILFSSASIFMYLSSSGIFDIFDTFPYYSEIAFLLEAIIFSIALADKLKQLETQKNEANMTLILQEQFEKQRLQKLVNSKTKELKNTLNEKSLLLKELNHRVKNNMQTIISLIRLQSNDYDDKKIQDMFLTIQNRISAMSSLHQLLYNQNNISYINAEDYFELIIQEIKSSYLSDKISINTNIQTNLKVEQAVYCGLIVNELVTNSFKYAFRNDTGKIDISLTHKDNKYMLTILDNGIGYKANHTTNSLGLLLINTLAKEQLKGNITTQSDKGVKVEIIWS